MTQDPDGKEGELIRRLLAPGAGHLVEVGCGDGRLTGELAAVSRCVTALEPELSALRGCRGSRTGAVRFLAGTGQALPIAGKTADTVAFTYSLHHQDPVRALTEAGRILASGGRMLVLEPARGSTVVELFAVVDDESEKYDQAEAAVEGSGLVALDAGSIVTRWVFEDREELTGHIFSHFQVDEDLYKEQEIAGILGDARDNRPLVLSDITRYWLLGKGTGKGRETALKDQPAAAW